MLRERYPRNMLLEESARSNFADAANRGALLVEADLVAFVGPNVTPPPEALRILAEAFVDERVAICGPAIRVAPDAVEYGATIDPLGTPVGNKGPLTKPFFVPGSLLVARTAAFRSLGGFDGRFGEAVSDIDLCWRALISGWDVLVATAVELSGKDIADLKHPAPGDWLMDPSRFVVRERNTLAMLLKCAPGPMVPVLAALFVAQAVATSVWLAARGEGELARGVLRSICWNVLQVPETMRLRTAVRRRPGSWMVAPRRMYLGIARANALLSLGAPRIARADEGGA
jgi:hypothetical protein